MMTWVDIRDSRIPMTFGPVTSFEVKGICASAARWERVEDDIVRCRAWM